MLHMAAWYKQKVVLTTNPKVEDDGSAKFHLRNGRIQLMAICSGLSGIMTTSSPVRSRRRMHSNTCRDEGRRIKGLMIGINETVQASTLLMSHSDGIWNNVMGPTLLHCKTRFERRAKGEARAKEGIGHICWVCNADIF